MTFTSLITLLSISLTLSACAGVFDSRPATGDRKTSPSQVTASIDAYRSLKVEWGGTIIHSDNLPTSSELEIIAYPIKSNGRPDTDETPMGRFIAVKEGYMETAEYANGRQVTLSGRITGLRDGKVGTADYRYPTVSVESIELWSQETDVKPKPSIHFGIGIGSGGRTSTGVGVGIGF